MKHAILVEGSGPWDVLQTTINVLDDPDIDYFIHWDKKYLMPNLNGKFSHIYFIDSQKVSWGTYTQIDVMKQLLQSAYEAPINYGMFHLISESDISLMDVSTFKKRFEKPIDLIGYQSSNGTDELQRIQFYYPFSHLSFRTKFGKNVKRALKLMNILLHIQRPIHGLNIFKGTNWFSIKRSSVRVILTFPYYDMFRHTYLGDELFVQTIIGNAQSKPIVCSESDNKMAGRYIDWHRGGPYVFTMKDLPELQAVANTKYVFARKVKDVKVARGVKKYLEYCYSLNSSKEVHREKK